MTKSKGYNLYIHSVQLILHLISISLPPPLFPFPRSPSFFYIYILKSPLSSRSLHLTIYHLPFFSIFFRSRNLSGDGKIRPRNECAIFARSSTKFTRYREIYSHLISRLSSPSSASPDHPPSSSCPLTSLPSPPSNP